MNYDKELLFAKDLAEKAGTIMAANLSLSTEAVWKADNTPLTATDTEINRLVIESVQKAFPSHGILGEEESFETKREILWVVDPIDGTQPFTLGVPLSTFCLSLVIEGQPVLGIINDPYMKRMFWAAKDQGAFVNNEGIHVSKAETLAQNFVILSSRMHNKERTTGEIFDLIEEQKAKSLNFRSFAYGSMLVACGRAVGTIIGVPNAWDASATKIIIEEAGGKVTDVDGNDRRYDGDGNGLLATNGLVHEQMLKLIHP